VAFIGPPDFAEAVRFGRTRFWLRAVNLENPFQSSALPAPPRVKGMHLNTAWAIQAETIQNEILGSSSATMNQTFTLAKFPVVDAVIRVNEKGALSESEQQELLTRADLEAEQVTDDAGNVTAFWVRWHPIEDLTAATASDRVYTIDPTFGQIRFGDGGHGLVPPLGRDNITATYQAGGGTPGNVGVGQVATLRTTIPFVDGVINPEPAGGGSDTEALDRALERAPQAIKNRGRAVTAEDFEWITREASQAIARVKVLPTFNDRREYETGWVTIIIVPESQDVRPTPSPQLRRRVAAYLRERAGNIITFPEHLHVTGPTYVEVRVAAELFPISPDRAPNVATAALERLRRFLHPLTGGYQGRGWEFGRLPCLSDFYALFEGLDGVDHADRLTITLQDVTPTGEAVGDAQHLTDTSPLDVRMPEHALIYSGNHTLTVRALR
jgi:predicted phage baseplate assembly protein